MDDVAIYLEKFKRKKQKNTYLLKVGKNKKLSNFLTKVLVSVIFFLVSLIYIRNDASNAVIYKKYVFSETLPFTKIKQAYENLFGEAVPVANKEKTVFGGSLVYKNIEPYQDGEKLTVSANSLVSNLTGGIIVYIGEKEGYGNTVIIQGNDGADIWYGNLQNVNVKLYDYVEKDTTIGETMDDTLYLVIKKNDTYLKYEDYKN